MGNLSGSGYVITPARSGNWLLIDDILILVENLNPEVKNLLAALDKKEKLVAMLAPSFPVVFDYPEIVGKLKRLGFARVVEVAHGAAETNRQLLAAIKKKPLRRLITGPCPTVVRLIRTKYPHLSGFLAKVDSPMVATAKAVARQYPHHRPVFIGPCPVKKLEASEDHPELQIIAITYKELIRIFEIKKLSASTEDFFASFDLIGAKTRLFPVSGGLTQSAGLTSLLAEEELEVISGPQKVAASLATFPTNRCRVLDVLFCDGGCVAGAGIGSQLSLEERRARVIAHWASSMR